MSDLPELPMDQYKPLLQDIIARLKQKVAEDMADEIFAEVRKEKK